MPAGTPVTRIVVDNSLFTGALTAAGWGAGDAPSTYAAPVTATAVDGARVSPGSPARSGQPGIDAGSALADALGAPGATVVLGEAPPTPRPWRRSSPRRSGGWSSRCCRCRTTCSPSRWPGRSRSPRSSRPPSRAGRGDHRGALRGGIDITGVALSDGSGLSQADRVPAGVLTGVVAGAADGSLEGTSALLSGLPVAGYDGTLFDRGDAGAAPGTVRAKTGTLLGVHALAGTVVTTDGRLLAFAVVADGSVSEVAAESALDDVAAALAGCGCR